ncbi:hypothetical protein [Geminocystis sp. NIES-3709]|uniref:hypothetical protein n=1 Tax=Geminocystis sp. NIES-3709 TaxID=1617448 RepID=UPI0005FCD4E0|nr:mobile element protein [Geminocystis sp. NIES-3709]
MDGDRNKNIERIKEIGRKEWKEESGYHRRSISETTMFRLKTIFGGKVSSGTLKNFGAKIASNTVRVRDLGKSHKNG